MSRTVKYPYNLFRVRCHCWLKRQRLGVPLHFSVHVSAVNCTIIPLHSVEYKLR